MRELLRNTLTRIQRFRQRKGKYGQIGFMLMIGVSMVAGAILDEEPVFLPLRYSVYRLFTDRAPFALPAANTALLEIRNSDYYGPLNNGRSPVSPRYLARIVGRLADYEAAVIGLDFDLRNPDPQNPAALSPEFRAELPDLRAAIRSAGRMRFVLLPLTLNGAGDSLDQSAIGDLTDPKIPGIVEGFINLPQDIRYVPTRFIDSREACKVVPSFALALADAKLAARPGTTNPALRLEETSRPPMVGFLHPETLVRVDAAELLGDDPTGAVRRKIQGRAVIVGGAWSDRSPDSGMAVDLHETPVGWQRGMYVHLNYAENLISKRFYPMAPPLWLLAFKFVALLAIGIFVGTADNDITKLAWILAVITGCVAVTYLLFTNIGLAADIFLPLTLILGEGLLDVVNEWREVTQTGALQAHQAP